MKLRDHPYPPLDPWADALFQRARAMERRVGRPRDYPTVARLYSEAALHGHWKAMINLAGLYRAGLGVERDYAECRALLTRAATMDVPEAFLGLADLHDFGLGVPQDDAIGDEYTHQAALRGHPVGQVEWGKHLMYVEGKTEEGLVWLREALDQDHAAAAYDLALYQLFGAERDDLYHDYMRTGARLGSADCLVALRSDYTRGEHGVSRDTGRAASLERMLAQLESDPTARFPDLDLLCPP